VAERAGHHPEVILAGRRVNDQMGAWIARECVKHLLNCGASKTVAVLGATFKEKRAGYTELRRDKDFDGTEGNSASTSMSPDPLAQVAEFQHEYGIQLKALDDLPPGRRDHNCGRP